MSDEIAWTQIGGVHNTYDKQYENLTLTRRGDVLELTLTTHGGPFVWSWQASRELVEVFDLLAVDGTTKVVIITGVGDTFTKGGGDWSQRPGASERLLVNGRHMHPWMFDGGAGPLGPLMIAAVNGGVEAHSELALVADIIVSCEEAYVKDGHLAKGFVPGDGIQLLWQYLFGSKRARYHILTGKPIPAKELHELGVVSELVPQDQVLTRSRELADELAQHPMPVLRYTRNAMNIPYRRMMMDNHELGYAMEFLGQVQNPPHR